MIRALLWDVDGTLAETERDGHRVAFDRAFEEAGLPWRWDEARYGELLRVTGGRERLLAFMATRTDAPVGAAARQALAQALHARKNEHYQALVEAGALALRPGVGEFIDAARARGLRQGIVTTTGRANVDALMRAARGPRWHEPFELQVCGEDVRAKKPDPEAYEQALARLGLPPTEVVALEDSPGGAAAARAAGISVVVVRSHYFAHAAFDEVLAIGPGLHARRGWRPRAGDDGAGDGPLRLDDLADWHAAADLVSCGGD